MANARAPEMNAKPASRNARCPCGSGKKYKHCCATLDNPAQTQAAPDSVELAHQYRISGDQALAVQMCERLLLNRPRDGKVLQLAGLLAYECGDVRRAVEFLQSSARHCPNDATIQCDLGSLLNVKGRLDDAAACFQRSLALDPASSNAHYNLGCTLQALGKLDAAEASYRQALALDPSHSQVLGNLGGCLQRQGKNEAAIACLKEALARDPQSVVNLVNLGMAYQDEGLCEKAAACHQAAVAIDPDNAEAHYALGVAMHGLRKLEEACDCYRRVMAIDPTNVKAHDNLLVTQQFIPAITAEELLAAHLAFAAQFETPLKPYWRHHNNIRDPAKRLKVGYVSGDFRTHAVAHFIKPLFRNHDRSQVGVFAYSNNRKNDGVTDELMAMADHWRPVFAMTDQQLADQIEADGIDVLVDLSGHTAYNRLLVFARKPAPLQVAYVGYLTTTGLAAMDYRITDGLAEPPGFDRYYTEKLLRFPDSMWCFEPADDAPEIDALPALKNGYLTFGSFNGVDKIDLASIGSWSALLKEIPTARILMMATPEVRPHFAGLFHEHGIASNRIEFFGKLPPVEFRKMIQRADISLDSFPVNGATTTCESLWQGVPVLSLCGERFLSRNGLSILSAAAMPDFTVHTTVELINTARLLADNLSILASIRAGMREHLRSTPLLDQRRFVANLEGMFRKIWINWCDGAI